MPLLKGLVFAAELPRDLAIRGLQLQDTPARRGTSQKCRQIHIRESGLQRQSGSAGIDTQGAPLHAAREKDGNAKIRTELAAESLKCTSSSSTSATCVKKLVRELEKVGGGVTLRPPTHPTSLSSPQASIHSISSSPTPQQPWATGVEL